MQTRKTILLVFLMLSGLIISAQTKRVDDLKRNIQLTQNEREKVNAIFALCELGYNVHPDTLIYYAAIARNISAKTGNTHDEIRCLYYKSGALTTKALIDSSLKAANDCLEMLASEKIADLTLEANLYNQKGRCFMRKNQYKEAVEMGYKTIRAAEKNKEVLLQIKGKTLIGWAFLEMGRTKEALNWHLSAMRTTRDNDLLAKYGILFANIALNYNGLGQTDSAFYYIEKAIRYSREHENLFALSNSLAIYAQLLVRSGQASQAETPLKEVVEIRKLIGDPFYIVSDMSQLGLYYANNGQPEKGIQICNEGIALARQYKIDSKLLFLYSSLSENYKAAGQSNKYAETLEKIVLLKDTVYQKNSAAALAEIQTRYETEKNENIIAKQKLTLAKKNYWLYGSLILLLSGIIIFYLIFTNYRKKQKLKSQILLEEEKYLSAQAVDRAKENERKRIAAELHDNLGAYAASLSSNLNYLQQEYADSNAGNAFAEIKNNSNAIISELNDTIWVLKKDMLSLTSISDRIKVFVNHIRKSYPHINVEVEEDIQHDHRMHSAQAFHLYRVVQEGVTNALKHSRAKNILVSISGQKSWQVKIMDDGSGMREPVMAGAGGNGLNNMKDRSREAGWNINWEPGKAGGTIVSITATTD